MAHVLFVTDAEDLSDTSFELWKHSLLSVVHVYLVQPKPQSIEVVSKLCMAKQGILQVENAQDLDVEMAEDFARRPHTYVGTLFDIEVCVNDSVLQPLHESPLNV